MERYHDLKIFVLSRERTDDLPEVFLSTLILSHFTVRGGSEIVIRHAVFALFKKFT